MLLAVDVGNTTAEFALFSGRTRVGGFRLMTREVRSEADLARCISDGLSDRPRSAVEGVLVCSVVPDFTAMLKAAAAEVLGVRPTVVNEDICPALGVLPGDTSRTRGADRIVACYAAAVQYGAPLILADFGTATTVDAVDRNGFFVGGSIAPGFRTCMDALAQQAAQLPAAELRLPPSVLGRDTLTQIQIGVVGQCVGGAEYLIRRTRAEMAEPNEEIRVIATGGFAELAAAHTDVIDIVDEDLIFDGLVRLWEERQQRL